MTAYELEGLSISEVPPFPLLELNKDLHCSRRNKPWISSRALIHIRTEILKHASATFSINYWVSKWWWFVIFLSSLLTIACFPPKNYVPDLKQRGRRLHIVKQLSDFTVVSVCGKQPFSPWSLPQQQHKEGWHWSVPQGTAVPEQGLPTVKLGTGQGWNNTEPVPRPCILMGFFKCWCHPVSPQSIASHPPMTQPSARAHTITYQCFCITLAERLQTGPQRR